MSSESIEMKIARTAASNWGQEQPKDLEEAKGITCGSEVSAISGIIQVLGLNPELQEKMIEDVYTKEIITPDIALEIKKAIEPNKDEAFASCERSIVNMLSVIHDGWVKSNSNKFLQEGRNKEYQFSPLMLLDWKEAKSDLLFLKPILEAAGIKIDEKEIEQEFEIMQKEFLIDKGLTSHEALVEFVGNGAKSYPAIEGIETKNGGNIEALLRDKDIAEKMAIQIEGRVPVKSREELTLDIIKAENDKMDEMGCVWTKVEDGQVFDEEHPNIQAVISRREMLLSELIGKPYPTYFLQGEEYGENQFYQNHLSSIGGTAEIDVAVASKQDISEKGRKLETAKSGYIVLEDGTFIKVTDKELMTAGLRPSMVDWVEGKDIAKGVEKVSVGIRRTNETAIELMQGGGDKVTTRMEKEEPMTKSGYELMGDKNVERSTMRDKHEYMGVINWGYGIGITKECEYIPESELTSDQLRMVDKYKAKLAKEFEKMEKDSKGKYDIPGKVGELKVTQRELLEKGIIPSEVGWQPDERTRISPKDIAMVDKEMALTTSDMGRGRNLFQRLLDKIMGREDR